MLHVSREACYSFQRVMPLNESMTYFVYITRYCLKISILGNHGLCIFHS